MSNPNESPLQASDILILGAGGQLGRDLRARFSRDFRVTGVDVDVVDIGDADAVSQAIEISGQNLVINAAAYTNVEGAEDDREAAFHVNETGARNVALACAAHGVALVHYSTDFVFDGCTRTPYEPDDPVSPRGVYAESKAAGERAVAEAWTNHYIVRTAWLYGIGGNNFVEKIIGAAESLPELKVVTDELGSPTYTADLADATAALVKSGEYGYYHCVNAGSCSRFEFAHAILKHAGLTTPIKPCLAEAFPSKAPRPKYSVLSNAKFEDACGYRMPAWEDALDRYIQRRKEEA
jgi:dTDP-4-dehydrorhamnose reductase